MDIIKKSTIDGRYILSKHDYDMLKEAVDKYMPDGIEEKSSILHVLVAARRHKDYTDIEIPEDTIQKIIESKGLKRLLGKAMAWKQTTVISDKTIERRTHADIASELMKRYCRAMRLNEDLGRAIGLGHDIGHPPFAHEGEKIIKDIFLRYGVGTFAHNIQGVKSLRDIEKLDIPWQVLHGIQTHNGEKLTGHVKFDPTITEEEAHVEYIKSNAIPGYEREQVPGTYEAAALVLIDKIAYCGQDLADGFREKVLTPRNMDPKLLKLIRAFGLSNEEVQRLLQQDRERTFETIDQYIGELNLLSEKYEGNTQIVELRSELEKARTLDFYSKYEFTEQLGKTASGISKFFENKENTDIEEKDREYWGYAAEELEALMNQDTSGGTLARTIENILLEDLIDNSKKADCPTMSEQKRKAMYDMIGYVQEEVVHLVCTEEQSKILENGTEKLIKSYTNILLASGFIDEKFPEYKNEEKDKNEDIGISDDPEVLTIYGSKIVGHTRKCSAKYLEDIEEIVLTAREHGMDSQLSIREAIAMRIAGDYVARNTDIDLVEKLHTRGFITDKEYEIVTTRDIERRKIEPGTSIYGTRVGMQRDDIIIIYGQVVSLNEAFSSIMPKVKTYAEAPESLIDSVENYSLNIEIALQEIGKLAARYDTLEDFDQKTELYEGIKIRMDALSREKEKILLEIKKAMPERVADLEPRVEGKVEEQEHEEK